MEPYHSLKKSNSDTSITLSEIDYDDDCDDIDSKNQTGSIGEGYDKSLSSNCTRFCSASIPKRPNQNVVGELITTMIQGKRCVLPFKYLSDLSSNFNHNKETDRRTTSAFDSSDPTHPNKTALVPQKKSFCGDFSCSSFCEARQIKKERTDLSATKTSHEIRSAKELKIDRTPFRCPISICQDFVSAAFYSSHLKVEHSGLILEILKPQEERTILVNPKLNSYGEKYCNIAYYMVEKLRDFGHGDFRNVVPVLLMSSKFRFIDLELQNSRFEQQKKISTPTLRTFHIFWLTGIVCDRLKTHYSLRIGSWLSAQGWIYPLSKKQDLKSVIDSGAGLMFSGSWVDKFITEKNQMLEMRLVLR